MISNPNPSIWVHAAQSSRRSARALTVRWPDALVHRQAEAFARWQGRIRREFQIQTASGSGCQSPGRLACANSDNSEPLTLRAMAAKRRKGRSNHRRRAKTVAFQSAAPTCLFGGDIQIWRDGRAITSCGVLEATGTYRFHGSARLATRSQCVTFGAATTMAWGCDLGRRWRV